MKIYTTGASGLIGSRVKKYLEEQGHDVRDASKTDTFDLLNENDFKSFFTDDSPDVIVHLAAFTNPAAAQDQNDDITGLCFQLNVELTRKIGEYALNHDVRLMYISTDYVFDGEKEGPYVESDQPEPQSWYGKTKYIGEREVVASGAQYTIMRTAYPFGLASEAKADLVQSLANKLKEGTTHPLFVDQIITPTYIPDICRAINEIVVAPDQTRNQIFHVVGDDCITPYELAARVQAQLGLDGELPEGSVVEFVKKPDVFAGRYPFNLQMSNKKFKDTFGFTFTSLDNALAASLL